MTVKGLPAVLNEILGYLRHARFVDYGTGSDQHRRRDVGITSRK